MIPGVDPAFVLIAMGLFFLVVGGDYLVRSAVAVAQHLRVSPLLIGLTLVGFGTSTPELVTSIEAAIADSPGIAIGNIVGSNIANILLIIGVSAVLTPVAVSAGASWRDGVVMILSAVAMAAVCLKGGMTQQTGLLFLAALLVYVLLAWASESAKPATGSAHAEPNMSSGYALMIAIGSLGVLIAGAQLLVQGSIAMARSFDISEAFIGLTIVAVGTSLPELFTSIVAGIRKQGDISVGNILGSNIYNILGVGGATAVIHPIPISTIPAQIQGFDNFVMIGVSVLLVLCLILARGVGRMGGLAFLTLYGAYIFLIHPSQADGMQSLVDVLRPLGNVLTSVIP